MSTKPINAVKYLCVGTSRRQQLRLRASIINELPDYMPETVSL